MKKTAGISAIALSLCMIFSGCSLGINDSSLLHPPKTAGREAELESLIEESANGAYKLKYPQNGAYRSAIITEDLNGDKKDEAIAFYCAGDTSTNILVMYDDGKKWSISQSFKIDLTEVDCVQFADYDYDGTEEIFAGFTSLNTGLNELNIFDCNTENHTTSHIDFKSSYSSFTTGDYDRDGANEILTFILNSNESDAQAVLTDYDKNELYTLARCDMDRAVTRFESVTSGLISNDTMGVCLDGFLENGYNSQVVYYNPDREELICYPVTLGKKQNQTARTYNVNCTDIDDDGFLEIPIIKSISPKSFPKNETVAPIISWSCLDTEKGRLSAKVKCVTNFEFGYYFKLSEKLSDNAIATLSEDMKTLKIYYVKSGSAEKLIATFKVFDVGTSTDSMSAYSTIESYNQYIYAFKIESNSPIYIDEDMIKENFALNDSASENTEVYF